MMDWIIANKTWLFDGFDALFIMAILGGLWKLVAIFFSEKKKTSQNDIPSKTITIVNNDTGYQNYWHIGLSGW